MQLDYEINPSDVFLFNNSASFDEKRKKNYDKGQAELERRRRALLEVQKKEQEERERKEREEHEKREKLRYFILLKNFCLELCIH